jgi:predicted acylesterase/phospholipase RssA
MKVSKKKVRYLCFEGGGGKGLIYLGAGKALAELGVLSYIKKLIGPKDNSKEIFRLNPKKIKGVAGTSVGALAATLIAAGYTPKELNAILTKNFGMHILDKVQFGAIPTVYTKENPRNIIEEREIPEDQEVLETFWRHYIQQEKPSPKNILQLPKKALNHLNRRFLASVLRWYVDYKQKREKKNHEKDSENDSENSIFEIPTTKSAFDKVLSSTDSMNSLKYEFGFFMSEFVRDFVDHQIEKKSGIKNCTFKQFYDEFKIDLVVTGFNMTRNEILYFRKGKQWNDICVADAVRMSVSIPIIFKPVYLSYDEGKILPVDDDLKNGDIIVDGGVGVNLPLHVFDEENSRSSKLNGQTVAFRLKRTINRPDDDLSMTGFVENLFFALLGMTTELQIRKEEEKDQVIELAHEGINALDFLYSEKTKKYIDMAYETTMKYFL